MIPILDSTPKADKSANGLSKDKPAAMNVDRRTRWDEGENEAPVTPERLVFRQKVVGRTLERLELSMTKLFFFFL
jgi:hypothetical protein